MVSLWFHIYLFWSLTFSKAVPMLPLVVAEDRTTNEILDGFELDRAQLKLVKLRKSNTG